MKGFFVKLFILFSTFTIGIAAYYFYNLSPANVEKIQNPPSTPDVVSQQVLKPIETDFYKVSPCDEPNFFKQYSARAKGTISGGVVNHRVECGDLPENPSNFSGVVTVYVLIDQYGEVENARIINGNRLLNKSVLRAARQTRFTPFILGGEPVKVRGVLMYKFEDDGKVGLKKINKPL